LQASCAAGTARGTEMGARRVGKPAEQGNRLAVTHGAHAQPEPLRVNDKVRALYDVLAAAAPVQDDGELPAADRMAVLLLAKTLCRLESVSEWLDVHGAVDRRGKPRSALRAESKLTNQALALLKELGATPRSRAALGVDLVRAVDLATAMSEPNPQ